MRDLGAALIFFFTFIVLAFMRSGDFRTIVLLCVGAAMAAGLVVLIRSDFVMARFATYRHVWDDMYGKGYQQTRVLIYSVSGGLLGVGIGDGKLKEVPAATEDLVFGMICEEWGIIMGILVILCIMFIAFHSIRCASGSRSAFYAISGIAAGCLLLFQDGTQCFRRHRSAAPYGRHPPVHQPRRFERDMLLGADSVHQGGGQPHLDRLEILSRLTRNPRKGLIE